MNYVHQEASISVDADHEVMMELNLFGKPIRTMAILELSYNCSFSCPFCCVPWLDNPALYGNVLSLQQWLRVIDRAIAEGAKTITFSGGEPFLNSDFNSIVNYMINVYPSISFTIYTNGDFLTKGFLCVLKETRGRIAITFQGIKTRETLTGRKVSHKSFMEKCSMVIDSNIPLDIALFVCNLNLYEFSKMLSVAIDINPETIQVNPIFIEGRAKYHPELWLSANTIENLKSLVQKKAEKAGRRILFDSELYCCCRDDSIFPSGQSSREHPRRKECYECLRFLVIGPNGIRRKCLHTLEPLEQWP